MVRRPDLGYKDEGLDFGDPASFELQRRTFGEARVLPRVAYRSFQFLYLEDEAIWTRDWVPVGTVHEIPETGDLLPFTLGYHGVHVQRMGTETFEGRFNLAQHGGCRVVPTQCQQGKRTSCSFTSCGYSRDRGPIQAASGNDDARTMYQYVGLRPERLHPVHVARSGGLMFLNVDPDPENEVAMTGRLPSILSDPSAKRVHREWMEFDANWKFAGQTLAATDEILDTAPQMMIGHRRGQGDVPLSVHWIFPNAILLSTGSDCCVIVLQHTAINRVMFRVELLSTTPLSDDRLKFWEAELRAAGLRAEALQQNVPKTSAMDPPVAPEDLPLQTEAAAWWFQNVLTDKIARMPHVESDVPIFRNVEHYLI